MFVRAANVQSNLSRARLLSQTHSYTATTMPRSGAPILYKDQAYETNWKRDATYIKRDYKLVPQPVSRDVDENFQTLIVLLGRERKEYDQ